MTLNLPQLTATGKTYLAIFLAGVVVGSAGSLTLAWHLWRPRPAPIETAAPAARQPDGSLVLQRIPDAKAHSPNALPEGATLERNVQVTVQPRAKTPAINGTNSASSLQIRPPTSQVVDTPSVANMSNWTNSGGGQQDPLLCPPVRVDLSLVRLKDGSRRVTASSPDGDVIGGVDVPVENVAPVKVLKWSLGATKNVVTGAWSAFVTRDVGPARLIVLGSPMQNGVAGSVHAGVALRF